MKYLKYLLGIIALIVLLFFGRGMLTPSISYSSEIIVEKSIKEAYSHKSVCCALFKQGT